MNLPNLLLLANDASQVCCILQMMSGDSASATSHDSCRRCFNSLIVTDVRCPECQHEVNPEFDRFETGAKDVELPNGIYGVAELDDKIYIASKGSNRILAYQDQTPYSELESEDIIIKDMKSPRDLAACHTSWSLFVCDLDGKRIWITQVSDKETRSIIVHGVPKKISVTPSNRLLVLVNSPELIGQSRWYTDESDWCLDFYNSLDVRTVVKRVYLPASMKEPQHAISLSSGKIIVAYQDGSRHDFRMSELSENGEILKTIAPSVVEELPTQMYAHLAAGESDSIVAIDVVNNRLLLIDPDLKFVREFLSQRDEPQLVKPHRICFTRHTHRMIIGCFYKFFILHFKQS